MSEEKELQAKIAALSGRIDQHKRHPSGSAYTPHTTYNSYGRGYGRGDPGWAHKPGTPYGVPRGRGRGASVAHRNRTLVLNSTTNSTVATPTPDVQTKHREKPQWVSKVDRHMQLINTAVYDQLSQQRTQAIAETAEQKSRHREQREKAKLLEHFGNTHSQYHRDGQAQGTAQQHRIVVQGVPFQVSDGGSKLLRISDPLSHDIPTPKRAHVGGVRFLRSKNGNLYRSGLVKASKRHPIAKSSELCPNFTSTGQCSKGPACRFTHDANKVAICKDFLAKGLCTLGDSCDLSHEPNAHRVPACVHFLRGNCTNDECRYAHVRVNPGAPVCRAFAKIGYCEEGEGCAERHVHECPDYANKGLCRNKKCRLPHVDRAGQLRKTPSINPDGVDTDQSPDLSSDEEEYDSEDFDSDHVDEILSGKHPGDVNGDLARQRDFVQF